MISEQTEHWAENSLYILSSLSAKASSPSRNVTLQEVKGESSQPGAGSTGHTTRVPAREASLVQPVQGGLPGLGQGALQLEALHPGDRLWPPRLGWTGCQAQAQDGSDQPSLPLSAGGRYSTPYRSERGRSMFS